MTQLLALIERLPLASVLTAVGFTIVALVGGIVTITNPQSLSFTTYVALVTGATGASGLLGIGRGQVAAAREAGKAVVKAAAVSKSAAEPHIPPPPARSIHR